jgi:hypothetical protein
MGMVGMVIQFYRGITVELAISLTDMPRAKKEQILLQGKKFVFSRQGRVIVFQSLWPLTYK